MYPIMRANQITNYGDEPEKSLWKNIEDLHLAEYTNNEINLLHYLFVIRGEILMKSLIEK